jgi:hypothetical protein
MAPLRLPLGYEMTVPPMSSIDGLEGIKSIDAARENAGAVLASAISIEDLMKKVILHTVFSEVEKKKSQVEELFLDSDWCGFNAKLQIILHIIAQDKLMTPPEKDEFGKALRRVMKSRNALAHGQMIWNGENLTLQFFESGPKTAPLDAVYWQTIEEQFQTAFEKLRVLHNSVVIK